MQNSSLVKNIQQLVMLEQTGGINRLHKQISLRFCCLPNTPAQVSRVQHSIIFAQMLSKHNPHNFPSGIIQHKVYISARGIRESLTTATNGKADGMVDELYFHMRLYLHHNGKAFKTSIVTEYGEHKGKKTSSLAFRLFSLESSFSFPLPYPSYHCFLTLLLFLPILLDPSNIFLLFLLYCHSNTLLRSNCFSLFFIPSPPVCYEFSSSIFILRPCLSTQTSLSCIIFL